MRGFPRRRIRRDMVEIRSTVAPDRAIRHRLARGDGGLVFEVEEVVWFLGDVEVFEVPYCREEELEYNEAGKWIRMIEGRELWQTYPFWKGD